jgi:hypothetical protein
MNPRKLAQDIVFYFKFFSARKYGALSAHASLYDFAAFGKYSLRTFSKD